MYSTCVHCLAPLGQNDAVERFPVARRLAYDGARGRLWAVCATCGRWNLAPVSERWEAIEECERLYRATHQRYGTDHIGLALLADGTELVRVGPALRPEMAAWRYGARLLRRARGRQEVVVHAAASLLAAGAERVGLSRGRADGVAVEEQALRLALGVSGPGQRGERVLDVVRHDSDGADVPVSTVRRRHLAAALLVRPEADGDPWQLEIPHEHGLLRLSGTQGLRTASKLLAAANRYGSSPEVVAAAARKVDEAMQPDGFFRRVLHSAWRWRWGRAGADTVAAPPRLALAGAAALVGAAEVANDLAVQLTGRSFWGYGGIGATERILLLRMPLVDRLALEMVAHEEAERTALDDELSALEAAWRDAEEIAAIVDGL
jgi:hypothetical protein